MTDRVRIPTLHLTPAAADALDRAGERLGVSLAATVELLASKYAGKLAEKDAANLPAGFRGRNGQGRRKKPAA